MSGPAASRDGVRAAIAELRSIRSTDPCASIAMTTLKATVHTLERQWLDAEPTVDRSDGG